VARLIWTPRALRDLHRLHGFLADKNRTAAQRAIKTIRESVGTLERHPEIGRSMSDMPDGYREWFIRFGSGGYLVVYFFDGKQVHLLAIRHGREAY
jgi:plasmid stabilization system protein ParE